MNITTIDDKLSELMNELESAAGDMYASYEWGTGGAGARARVLQAKGDLREFVHKLLQQQAEEPHT